MEGFIENLCIKNKNKLHNLYRANQKRQYKNTKYGFGGQKKRSKMNTKESSADMSSFNTSVNQGRPGFNKSKKGGKVSRYWTTSDTMLYYIEQGHIYMTSGQVLFIMFMKW